MDHRDDQEIRESDVDLQASDHSGDADTVILGTTASKEHTHTDQPIPTNSTEPESLGVELALAYAEQGWHVFPCDADKRPLVKWTRQYTKDPGRVGALWAEYPGALVGVPTGAINGMVAVDIDIKNGVDGFPSIETEGLELPVTFTQTTRSSGRHYWFADEYGETGCKNAFLSGVDIKGEGGYVIAYEAPPPAGIADAPEWLPERIPARWRTEAPATAPVAPAAPFRANFGGDLDDRQKAYVQAAMDSECNDVRRAVEGTRANTIYHAARALGRYYGGGVLAAPDVEQALLSANRESANPLPDREASANISNGIRDGAAKPRTVPEAEPAPNVIMLDLEAMKRNADARRGVSIASTGGSVVPVDPWEQRRFPPLPDGLLSDCIERFARSQAAVMGADPGGLAMAALTVCAAAITDEIKLRVRQYDDSWHESARIWTALIGGPSRKKSPIMRVAGAPLVVTNDGLVASYQKAIADYMALPAEERRLKTQPPRRRVVIEDTTVEAAQEVLRDSPDGVLLFRDELSAWFGSMEKYSGTGRGAQADRGFWLQSFNGGSYNIERIARGSALVPNLSVSMLGGIQPEPMRSIAAGIADDGLLQRFFPVVLGAATVGVDKPDDGARQAYAAVIKRLHRMKPPTGDGNLKTAKALTFSLEAQAIQRELEHKHHGMAIAWETVNRKLAAHIGKYDGLFARLCTLWHCIETGNDRPADTVSEGVARRVADFLHGYLFPHAVAFYADVLGLSDNHDTVLTTAGWILTHRPEFVRARDVQRGDRAMRSLSARDVESVMEKLEAFGWVEPAPTARHDSKQWSVRPEVYRTFAERAEAERKRRGDIVAAIKAGAS